MHPDSSPGLALDSDSGPVVAIIPARYQSSRLPGKALADIGGRPMIEHVYRRAAAATSVSSVLVATDDERILEAVRAFGGVACMTSPDHQSGTDRLAEVAAELGSRNRRQRPGRRADDRAGDDRRSGRAAARRPDGGDVDAAPAHRRRRPISPIPTSPRSSSIARATRSTSRARRSRTRAPAARRRRHGATSGCTSTGATACCSSRRSQPTALEASEALEQLRALEHGIRILAVETRYDSIGVDTPDDLERVRRLIPGALRV